LGSAKLPKIGRRNLLNSPTYPKKIEKKSGNPDFINSIVSVGARFGYRAKIQPF